MDDFELTAGERAHPLWLRLRAHMEQKLDVVRWQICRDVEMSEKQTAAMRGRARCLESLISLGDIRPVTGD